ncbi:MAG: helix-turn-helix domain-containing protein [Clostridiales bacterium]|nr:helix-turn-helix domain-containing protein [Clostridiales bacterium]
MEKSDFGKRLSELRGNKGVSARDMSLTLGQSPGYINNVENGINYPSMTLFFYICEYLGVSPKDFFDIGNTHPDKINELLDAVKDLDADNLSHLIALAKALKQK